MTDFNERIIEDFRAHDGHVGPPFEGAPMVLLHHRGAKSGTERVTPLVWFPDGNGQDGDGDGEGARMIIVASAAGAPNHPAWYHNLTAHPEVTAEVGQPGRSARTLRVRASEVTGPQRDEIYARIVAVMPGFGEYERKTAGIRTIPIFPLRPVTDASPEHPVFRYANVFNGVRRVTRGVFVPGARSGAGQGES